MSTAKRPKPSLSRQKLQSLLIIVLLSKIFIFGLIFLGYQQIPYCEVCRTSNFLYPEDSPNRLISAYQTWDAQHYLHLAEVGYKPDQMSNAFAPLFPLLIFLFRPLFLGNTFLTGLVLSNIFSLMAVIYFYLFVKERYYPQAAFTASLFLLAFPTAFYLSLIYTESLFLMLVMIAFYALEKRRIIPALIAGLLLPLTRVIGLVVVIPLIFQVLFTNKYASKLGAKLKGGGLLAASFGTGFALYLALIKYYTDSYFGGFEAQQYFFSNYAIQNLLNPLNWVVKNFIAIEYTFHGFNTSFLNRLFFLIFLLLLYLIYKRLDGSLFIYALVVGLIPALSGELDSFPRYLLVVFPIFIAIKFSQRHKYLIVAMSIVQLIFLLVHSANYWMA